MRGAGSRVRCSARDWRAPTLQQVATAAARICSPPSGPREARLGQWGEAAYQVRSAENTSELLRYRATFQVIEGRVARVGLTGGTVYLNFDRDWRRSFSASLRRDDASLLGDAYAGNPRGLEGRNVRVRGWIEERGGAPVIDLSSAGAVELLDDTPGQPPRSR